jgi:hypothetical protein
LGGDELDLYFDGRGYLFVSVLDQATLDKAVRLARHTRIYIVAHHARDDLVDKVKHAKDVELYRLQDMAKTMWFSTTAFDQVMFSQHHVTFSKL